MFKLSLKSSSFVDDGSAWLRAAQQHGEPSPDHGRALAGEVLEHSDIAPPALPFWRRAARQCGRWGGRISLWLLVWYVVAMPLWAAFMPDEWTKLPSAPDNKPRELLGLIFVLMPAIQLLHYPTAWVWRRRTGQEIWAVYERFAQRLIIWLPSIVIACVLTYLVFVVCWPGGSLFEKFWHERYKAWNIYLYGIPYPAVPADFNARMSWGFVRWMLDVRMILYALGWVFRRVTGEGHLKGVFRLIPWLIAFHFSFSVVISTVEVPPIPDSNGRLPPPELMKMLPGTYVRFGPVLWFIIFTHLFINAQRKSKGDGTEDFWTPRQGSGRLATNEELIAGGLICED